MTKPGTQPTFSRRVARLLCLVAFAALLLPVAACGRDEPNRPAEDDVAATVAAAVAATVAAQATAPPTAAPLPSATPTPPALAGRWRYEHNEEGLHYTDVFEFFDDGLYTARLEGVTSFCREFEDFPGCQAMPDIPIDRGESGTYEFLSPTQVRLRDTTGQLDTFTIVDLSPTRLVIVMSDRERAYERVP